VQRGISLKMIDAILAGQFVTINTYYAIARKVLHRGDRRGGGKKERRTNRFVQLTLAAHPPSPVP
jgi:hypothetical protein